jgi:hypothetical protein
MFRWKAGEEAVSIQQSAFGPRREMRAFFLQVRRKRDEGRTKNRRKPVK